MRNLIFLLIISYGASCKKASPASVVSFDYLVGNWVRINEKDSLATYENWSKVDGQLYHGHAFTLKGMDTIWQEHTSIKKQANGMVYEVRDLPQGTIIFTITSSNDSSFICENLENEFPKKIAYSKNGINLAAMISGGGPEIPYEFKKIN